MATLKLTDAHAAKLLACPPVRLVLAGANGDARNPHVDACQRSATHRTVNRVYRDSKANSGSAPLAKRAKHDDKESNMRDGSSIPPLVFLNTTKPQGRSTPQQGARVG